MSLRANGRVDRGRSDGLPQVSILLVDDHPANLLALEAVLEPLGHKLVRASSGAEALARLNDEERLALVLMDGNMPGLDGFQTAALMKQRESSRDIPIIFVTGMYGDTRYAARGYSVGAIDYVVKPFDPELMRAKVSAHVAHYQRGLQLKQQTQLLVEKERQAAAARAAAEAAEVANRAKDELLAMVSHELRTPLNTILGWAELLVSGKCGALDERAVRAAATISRNARLQSQLIEDLLDVSRIASGTLRLNLQRSDVARLVSAQAESARPAALAKQVTVEIEVARAPLEASCDPARIEQVMTNLLSNAIKFSPRGSRVMVRLDGDEHTWTVRVSDQGPGIPPDLLPHIFEPFWQADRTSTRRHGGLGLGLAIVRRIVELHGGEIDAHSQSDRGTTFTIRVPLEPVAATLAELTERATSKLQVLAVPSRRLDGMRLLVVDDDPDARELLRALFDEAGARVTTCESTEEARVALAADRYELVVSDLAMPGEDGCALARSLEHRLPAIAVSAHGTDEDRERALTAGFAAHVSKPFDPVSLVGLVASFRDAAKAKDHIPENERGSIS
jgi:signal transduction histidine kinase